MGATKVYRAGNYIRIVDSNGVLKTDFANQVKITQSSISSTDYTFQSDDIGLFTLPFSDIKDINGNAYVNKATWDEWYSMNTGSVFDIATTESVTVVADNLDARIQNGIFFEYKMFNGLADVTLYQDEDTALVWDSYRSQLKAVLIDNWYYVGFNLSFFKSNIHRFNSGVISADNGVFFFNTGGAYDSLYSLNNEYSRATYVLKKNYQYEGDKIMPLLEATVDLGYYSEGKFFLKRLQL